MATPITLGVSNIRNCRAFADRDERDGSLYVLLFSRSRHICFDKMAVRHHRTVFVLFISLEKMQVSRGRRQLFRNEPHLGNVRRDIFDRTAEEMLTEKISLQNGLSRS